VRTAQDFDRYYETPDPWGISKYRFRDRALRRLIGSYLFDRAVLELGCGEGHLTQAVFGDACAVTGVDISTIAFPAPPHATFQTPVSRSLISSTFPSRTTM